MSNKDLLEAIRNMKPAEQNKYYEDNMNLFWYWISERHEIFRRRYVEKQLPPWTEDPILKEYKFTNVFRQLDRGTVFYKERILDYCEAKRDGSWNWFEQWVYETLIYRHFNHIPTWEALETPLREDDGTMPWKQVLYNLDRVYTNAHNVTGVRWSDSDMKIENSMFLIDQWGKWVGEYAKALRTMVDMQNAYIYVRENIIGYGPFTAYEFVCDMAMLQDIPFTDDEWANAGPGARRGLARIFPLTSNSPDYLTEKMRYLRENQEEFFNKYYLPFFSWPSKLTMRAIEHSLCEFSKYAKAYYGEGRPRNKYRGTEPGMKELVYNLG